MKKALTLCLLLAACAHADPQPVTMTDVTAWNRDNAECRAWATPTEEEKQKQIMASEGLMGVLLAQGLPGRDGLPEAWLRHCLEGRGYALK